MSNTISIASFKNRALRSLMRAWSGATKYSRENGDIIIDPSLPDDDIPHLLEMMRLCVSAKGGEVTARHNTVQLGIVYQQLNTKGRGRFLKLLAQEFGLDHTVTIQPLIAQYAQLDHANAFIDWEQRMRDALIAPRSLILKQFSALPEGLKFLMDMRADLLAIKDPDPALKGLMFDLKRIVSGWFDIGLLNLVEIDWNKTAPVILEKLIAYEAVHEIKSWDDLKNRLDDDRKIYAFFHSKIPTEPLVFLQIAFTHGMADNIQTLLDTHQPIQNMQTADTALFYSISNTQAGLKGISLGNFLIKQAVSQLSKEYPHIKQFATLSPIPGFMSWLKASLNTALIEDAQRPLVESVFTPGWHQDAALSQSLKPILMRLCVHYLLREKRQHRPLDPVANFHLFNGAALERLNWLADTSIKGLSQSAGMMVNYNYKLNDIEKNHDAFVGDGKIVASPQIEGYL